MYKNKYLKYKSKYINYKKKVQKGGSLNYELLKDDHEERNARYNAKITKLESNIRIEVNKDKKILMMNEINYYKSLLDYKYWESKGDLTIKCKEPNMKAVEFVTLPSNGFVYRDLDEVLKELKLIMQKQTKTCLETNNNSITRDKNLSTCGTHVHISYNESGIFINGEDIKNFIIFFNNQWVDKYQDIFIRKFYKYQNRDENRYCKKNIKLSDINFNRIFRMKHQMINYNYSNLIEPNFHIEFRGLGEIVYPQKIISEVESKSELLKIYILDIISLFYEIFNKWSVQEKRNLSLKLDYFRFGIEVETCINLITFV